MIAEELAQESDQWVCKGREVTVNLTSHCFHQGKLTNHNIALTDKSILNCVQFLAMCRIDATNDAIKELVSATLHALSNSLYSFC